MASSMTGTPPHHPQLALGSTILLQRLLQSLLRRVRGLCTVCGVLGNSSFEGLSPYTRIDADGPIGGTPIFRQAFECLCSITTKNQTSAHQAPSR